MLRLFNSVRAHIEKELVRIRGSDIVLPMWSAKTDHYSLVIFSTKSLLAQGLR